MVEGPRPPAIAEYEQLLKFLNINLRSGHSWSILDEYPTALHPANLHNVRIMTDQKQILSHAVVRPMITKTPVGVFKLGAIGSVVTDPSFRNQGLSQKIIDECISVAKAQECEIAVLWSNLYEFYRKFGFELAGSELSFVIQRELPVPSTHLKILKGNKVDAEAILRLFNQHTVASVRTVDDIRKYLKIPNSNLYTAWAQDGQMVAYAVEGKGADLQAYIHEWGGNIQNLLPLLNYMYRDQKRPLTLIVPQHAKNLVSKLRSLDTSEVPGFLGMIKVLNFKSVFNKLNRHFKEVAFEQVGEEFFITSGGHKFQTESESDIVRLIFGPQMANELYSFDSKIASTLESVLPVPMWVWGWDSI